MVASLFICTGITRSVMYYIHDAYFSFCNAYLFPSFFKFILMLSNLSYSVLYVFCVHSALTALHCRASDLGALQQLLVDQPNLLSEEGMQELSQDRTDVLMINNKNVYVHIHTVA